MQLQLLDNLVILSYLIGVSGLGWYFSKTNTSTEEYFVGGRRFAGWVIGLSLVGTSISSITFLAYPADAFKTTWLRFLPNLMLPIAIAFAAWKFLPFFRRNNYLTAYQFLEERFSPSIRVYASVAFIFAQLVRISIILYLLALLAQEITGLAPWICIVGAGLFVSFYTIAGGIRAVIWTDVIQTIILGLGGLLCFTVIIQQLPGGLSQLLDIAAQHQKLSFDHLDNGQLVSSNWQFSLSEKTAGMMLLVGLTAWLTEYSSNQNTVQRFCAAESTEAAKKAMWICAGVSLPIWAFYMFLGTALFAFYQVFPDPAATAILAGESKAEHILPLFITQQLPAGITGLVIAAALAAAMSSLDSSINAISTVSVVDIYKRHLKPCADDRQQLKIAHMVAIIASGFMIIGAFTLQQTESATLQHSATILTAIMAGGLLSLYLLAFFQRDTNIKTLWTGIICTMVFTLWTIASSRDWIANQWQSPFDSYYAGLLGNILLLIIVLLGQALFRAKVVLIPRNNSR